VPASVSDIADSFFRASVQGLVPYEPGLPVEEVQRELGLERCVKLASNEGPFGPFPAALDAIARSVAELNRYPDGGTWRLRKALADQHGVRYEELAVGAGADGLVDSAAADLPTLFDREDRRPRHLEEAIDAVRDRHGAGAVQFGRGLRRDDTPS